MSYLDKYLRLLQMAIREWGAFVGRKRMIKPRFWLLMMAALVLVFTCVYVSQGQFIDRQSLRIQQLEAEYGEMLSANQQLERKIAFSKTDAYVERVAHEELGLLKENEIRFVAAGQSQEIANAQ